MLLMTSNSTHHCRIFIIIPYLLDLRNITAPSSILLACNTVRDAMAVSILS